MISNADDSPISQIALASQIPSDLEIACDPAVSDAHRSAAWQRYEDEKWYQSCLEGMHPGSVDYLILRRICMRLVAAGIRTGGRGFETPSP